ncbi:metalloprotease TldD [Asticcacaulis sp. EMRT-3]|uniref:metalloprotease TldD n=1 Tax=Asticcacaulis sp. EMRT-3 TaxID=3040349 RepID=UPI0024AF54EB|nr:metalloprotease TldD [Asticcacaulis sp. EMRT-3]MDI7774719.1 metalloprotease TldD [Asticcacaulis sp. EMRT-3]
MPSSPAVSPSDWGDFDLHAAQDLLEDALKGADDGEIYLERRESESLLFDDGRLKSSAYNADQGFGLRVVAGETIGFANSAELSLEAVRRAAEAAVLAKTGKSIDARVGENPARSNQSHYKTHDPIGEMAFADKIALLQAMDAYARDRPAGSGGRVVQVSASLAADRRFITIMREGGEIYHDDRPLVRLNVSVSVERNGRRETASAGGGGRISWFDITAPELWQAQVDEALRQALVNLDSIAAPAGEMDVVLGPGWPGVLLHEAVGHGLEGDFNRKGTSAFSGKMGQQVAARGVTIVDDGTVVDARGSLNIDDEGTATSATTLIEDGILVGYMHDRLSARQMGVKATGNGRRQSYAHQPLPRMTNTFMREGRDQQAEMIANTKKGLFAVNFGGGQVDITNGKFVFQCTEAYLIEDGKVGAPVKGATLIGDGPAAMRQVDMIGDDFRFDPGVGTCGKAGQSLPVGIGQPSLRIRGLTVGGTNQNLRSF